MTVLLSLAGLLVGGLVGGVPGLLAGAAIGFLLGQQIDLRKRLMKIEEAQSRVDEMQSWATEMKTWAQQTHAWLTKLGSAAQPAEAQPDVAVQPGAGPEPEPAPQPGAELEPETEPAAQPVPEPAAGAGAVVRPVASGPTTEVRAPVPGPATPAPPDASTRAPRPREPAATSPPAATRGAARGQSSDPVSWLVDWIKQWVTTGNAPVKVGVLVSLVGVGLLLREAHRRGIIELTIEVRLTAAAVFGVALLAVGWRQRRARPIYGLNLQGGGVAALYLTTYAAFVVYDVLGAVPAAAAVVIVTVGAGVLSVLQDSRPLAVLGIIGGFLAPVLTYSRPDDHVYVFSFFLVLNAAIVGVAWFKTWPELNLLGFGFTFGLTFFWLSHHRYDQDGWIATQPFIALFVLMYMGMPALFAAREAPDLRAAAGGTRDPDISFLRGAWTTPLVFGTPFAGLGLQQLALGHTEYGLAVTAAGLAAVQGALALASRRMGADRRQLAEAYAGLGVAFSAIAVPLALDTYFTSTVWAVQGLVLMWLGCRRDRPLPLGGGAVLQVLAAASFAVHLGESLPYPDDVPPIANEYLLGALLLAVAGLTSGWRLSRRPQRDDADRLFAWVALAWGAVWWLAAGLMEIVQQLSESGELSSSLGFMVGSFAAGSLAARRLRWRELEAVGLLVLPTLVLMLALSVSTQSHPLDRWGWAAWPPAFAVHYLWLRRREDSFARLSAWLHAGGYWTLAALAAREVYWQVDRVAEGVWPLAATTASILALVAATIAARRGPAWPVAAPWRAFLLGRSRPVRAGVTLGSGGAP
ncbi:MAG: DUF2339 domain-containing protein, partial [Acidimicrobiaceae bacterium]|nr:DUF2339 domain-containing protein [Acidimicrobiaceae bacterium]